MQTRVCTISGVTTLARCGFPLLAGVFLATLAPSTSFAMEPQQCLRAYENAQVKRRDGALLAARSELQTCSRAECAAAIRSDCVTWLDEVQRSIPSITLRAQDGDADVFDVEVRLDGVKIKDSLDGKALELDPGTREFTFVRAGKAPVVRKVMIVPGPQTVLGRWEKPKPAATASGPAAPAAPVPMERPVPLLTYGLLGLGVVGVAGFAYFGSTGKKDKDDLSNTCAPFCAKSDVDAVNKNFLLADISGGVGAAALVGASLVYLLRPEKPVPSSTQTGLNLP